MSEIIEKVAEAIRTNGVCGYRLNGETVFCDNEGLPSELRDPECVCKSNAVAAVKATIEHLRDNVSEGVEKAGRAVEPLHSTYGDVFRAMLSQTLSEIEDKAS